MPGQFDGSNINIQRVIRRAAQYMIDTPPEGEELRIFEDNPSVFEWLVKGIAIAISEEIVDNITTIDGKLLIIDQVTPSTLDPIDFDEEA